MGDFSAFAVPLHMSVPYVGKLIQILKPLKTLESFFDMHFKEFKFHMYFST